jgi:hypothetical protein
MGYGRELRLRGQSKSREGSETSISIGGDSRSCPWGVHQNPCRIASHPDDPNLLSKLAVFLLEDTDRRDPAAARRYVEEACWQTSYADPAILFALAQALAAGDQNLSQAIEAWVDRVGR